jgi:hypothetical protein
MTQALNGCHGRAPFNERVIVQDGYYEARDGFGAPVRSPKYIEVPFRMRQDCSYANETDLGRADPRCTGCPWKNAA